jgi:nitroreductase
MAETSSSERNTPNSAVADKAETMDAIKCMKTRRRIRTFLDDPIPRAVVEDIVECGRLAATANNLQPWVFIAVEDPLLRKQIAAVTDWGKFIAEAPVCIAVFCSNTKYFLEDGSAATQNILNAARARGLGSCWVAGHQKKYAGKVREMLGVPDSLLLVSLVALGQAAEEPDPAKKGLAEVLHWDRYTARFSR